MGLVLNINMSSATSTQSTTVSSNISSAVTNVNDSVNTELKTVKSLNLATKTVEESSEYDPTSTADISIKETASNLSPNYLRNVVFIVYVKNNGPNNVSKVKVSFPTNKTNFKWISDDSKGLYNPVTGIWTINNLKSGNSMVLHVVEKVLTCDKTVTTMASYDSGSFIDTNPNNNFSKLNLTIQGLQI